MKLNLIGSNWRFAYPTCIMDDLSQFMIFITTTLVLADQSWMIEAVVSGPHPELLHHGERPALDLAICVCADT